MEGGRWKGSSLGYGHGEDHPDEQAADDVLGGFAEHNDNEGQRINHWFGPLRPAPARSC